MKLFRPFDMRRAQGALRLGRNPSPLTKGFKPRYKISIFEQQLFKKNIALVKDEALNLPIPEEPKLGTCRLAYPIFGMSGYDLRRSEDGRYPLNLWVYGRAPIGHYF